MLVPSTPQRRSPFASPEQPRGGATPPRSTLPARPFDPTGDGFDRAPKGTKGEAPTPKHTA